MLVDAWDPPPRFTADATASAVRRRCDLQMRDVPFFLQDFTDRCEGRYRDIRLPLPMRLV